MARVIGVATTARSDFGCLRPVIRTISARHDLDLRLYVSGMHFSAINGFSHAEVEAEFGPACVKVPCRIESDNPAAVATAMGGELAGFAQAFAAARPDILVVLGDRLDMIPAVLAAVPFNIPVAHLSGGELTQGVVDDGIRHAVTKLAHLHFPTSGDYGQRLLQMGEEPWRIHVVGEPGLDDVSAIQPRSKDEVFAEIGFDAYRPLSIFTFHPETIEPERSGALIAEVLAGAAKMDTPILFTYPNADPGSAAIVAAIEAFVAAHPSCRVVRSLGRERFFQVLSHCDAVVGNSSAGIVEAASFALPAVNIGERQRGRIAPANVLSVAVERTAIVAAWRRALSPEFRRALTGASNPYGDGRAAERIVTILATMAIDRNLLTKRFVDTVASPAAQ